MPPRSRVAAATLTGSEPAGQSVAAICGDEIKPTVMELGGSDLFIVMPSIDLDEAIKTAAQSGHPLREAPRRY